VQLIKSLYMLTRPQTVVCRELGKEFKSFELSIISINISTKNLFQGFFSCQKLLYIEAFVIDFQIYSFEVNGFIRKNMKIRSYLELLSIFCIRMGL
jgi:hypothetical protein